MPVNAVNSLDDLFHDPHLSEVGFWQEFDHPTEGKLKMPGFPANFSKTPATIRKHAPKLGEHTVEILKEAGIDQEIIEEMISSKATLVSD